MVGACVVGVYMSGTCMTGGVCSGGMCGGGTCMAGGLHGRENGNCSGWHISYWNAFLFLCSFQQKLCQTIS